MSNSLEELATSTFEDVPEEFVLPPGVYIAQITRAKLDQTNGTPPSDYIELKLNPIEVVESTSELSDDDLANAMPVWEKLWLTEKARKYTKRVFTNALGMDNDTVSTTPLGELVEAMIGQYVKIVTVTEPYKAKDGETKDKVAVKAYKPVP